jgi:hypothetical protein
MQKGESEMSEPAPALKQDEAPKPETAWSMSPTIGKLAEALAKAQLKFDAVIKDSANPAYHSKYADLATVIGATQPHLAAEGLSIIQMPHAEFGDGDAKILTLTTLMAHSSGEWLSSDLKLPAMMRERFDAQSVGSAITYGRRYAWAAMTGVAQEDDDGNKASGIGTKEAAQEVGKQQLRKAAARAGNDAVVLTEWNDVLAVSGEGGLAILKSECDPDALKEIGFKKDGNVLTIPVGNWPQLEDLCKRAKVELHWAKSAKQATGKQEMGT